MHGCHNRAPYKETREIQDGWVYGEVGSKQLPVTTRYPRMKVIAYRNSMECQYTKMVPEDNDCSGCRWQSVQLIAQNN